MTAFADYTFYKQHGGRLTETAYNAAVDDAHAEILLQTGGRASTAPAGMQEALKLCECKLVDVIAAYQEGAALLSKGVGSISNDGYSVSMDAANPLQAEAQERRVVCARYLQQPVNLMCRWL
jgi:3-hydroxy-3-methylglutaryl CoA synthase